MARIGDRDRDRAAAALRRHYLAGRLTVDELQDRTELALRARSHLDLGTALRDLPAAWLQEVVEPAVKAAGNAVVRAGVFFALLTVWGFASLFLLVLFAVAAVVNGPSVAEVIGFPLVWLLLSWGLWRYWHHGAARRA